MVLLQAVEDAFVPVIKMTFDGIEVSDVLSDILSWSRLSNSI